MQYFLRRYPQISLKVPHESVWGLPILVVETFRIFTLISVILSVSPDSGQCYVDRKSEQKKGQRGKSLSMAEVFFHGSIHRKTIDNLQMSLAVRPGKM